MPANSVTRNAAVPQRKMPGSVEGSAGTMLLYLSFVVRLCVCLCSARLAASDCSKGGGAD